MAIIIIGSSMPSKAILNVLRSIATVESTGLGLVLCNCTDKNLGALLGSSYSDGITVTETSPNVENYPTNRITSNLEEDEVTLLCRKMEDSLYDLSDYYEPLEVDELVRWVTIASINISLLLIKLFKCWDIDYG